MKQTVEEAVVVKILVVTMCEVVSRSQNGGRHPALQQQQPQQSQGEDGPLAACARCGALAAAGNGRQVNPAPAAATCLRCHR